MENITGQIRVICNSDLNVQDVDTAKAANYAMRREWCAVEPEKYSEKAKPRFARLYQFLRSGKMHVKVLPREKFGLVHGKAGIVTMATGAKTFSFVTSSAERGTISKIQSTLKRMNPISNLSESSSMARRIKIQFCSPFI